MSMPWINSMPKRWTSLRAKNMFSKQSRPVREKDDVVTCFRDGTVTLRKNRRITGFTESIQWSGYQGVRKGDLVIHVMDAFAGAIGVSDSDGKSTPVYSVCTPKMDLNCHYYAYLLREMARTGFIQSLYRGIRERSSDFRFEVFSGLFLPLPPREEQDQIVRYLDWKVSRINKLINAKRWQIELLREQKQAVIFSAVTKGISNNVTLKKNIIEWIESIPSHWKIRTLYGVATEQEKSNKGVHNQNLLSLSYGKVVNKDINTTDGLLPVSFDSYQILNNGNIVLRLTDLQNDHKSLRVGLSTQTGIITSAYTCLMVRQEFVPSYVYYLLHAYDICKVFYGMGGGVRQSIGYKDIRKLPILVPPKPEQDKIVTFLDERCKNCERVEAKLTEELTLLAEYRTRLVSDVVTGKLDVRGVFVPKYEVVEDVGEDESESLDEKTVEDGEE